jgi:hypothetical protein
MGGGRGGASGAMGECWFWKRQKIKTSGRGAGHSESTELDVHSGVRRRHWHTTT